MRVARAAWARFAIFTAIRQLILIVDWGIGAAPRRPWRPQRACQSAAVHRGASWSGTPWSRLPKYLASGSFLFTTPGRYIYAQSKPAIGVAGANQLRLRCRLISPPLSGSQRDALRNRIKQAIDRLPHGRRQFVT